MEQLQDCVSSKFLMLEKPELIKVSLYLKCNQPSGEGFPGQTRRALIRLSEGTLDEIEGSLEEEQYAENLNELLCFIESLKKSAEPKVSPVTQSEIEKLREDTYLNTSLEGWRRRECENRRREYAGGGENADVTGTGEENVPQENSDSEEGNRDSVSELEVLQSCTYPQRQRHQLKMLTYNELGEPTVVRRNVVLKDVNFQPACGQNLWRPWTLLHNRMVH
ncbi:hypothetical protein Q7C36_004661 [Tachysurus vachellii]|uniref:Uncharacterized protein n=1 Tax=Tachysurus vachellii TaxID=175792 RepID=A0AA88NIW3_TACVA|nr:hypothetical protein Q7C36_004661 [Tachysurus vachellii]